MRWVALGVCVVGCSWHSYLVDAARARGSAELRCPSAETIVIRREDLSVRTFDVEGCGQRVRYTCEPARGYPMTAAVCVPEPAPHIVATEQR